jgi:hypothetical protein
MAAIGAIACDRRTPPERTGSNDGSGPQLSDVVLDEQGIEVISRWLVNEPDERSGRTTVFFLELPNGA